MRKSQGILSQEAFNNKLHSGEFEVLKLPDGCYALIQWIDTDTGKALWILTCAGMFEFSQNALSAIESYARKNSAVKIAGVARWGWTKLLQSFGFRTGTKLVFFEKELL